MPTENVSRGAGASALPFCFSKKRTQRKPIEAENNSTIRIDLQGFHGIREIENPIGPSEAGRKSEPTRRRLEQSAEHPTESGLRSAGGSIPAAPLQKNRTQLGLAKTSSNSPINIDLERFRHFRQIENRQRRDRPGPKANPSETVPIIESQIKLKPSPAAPLQKNRT